MHNSGYKSALARRVCRYSDARPPRKTDGVLLESEIPPRMRGKISRVRDDLARVGITPAYAGKRHGTRTQDSPGEDHPRVCGEKSGDWDAVYWNAGSPPRMRGKAVGYDLLQRPAGITPAYAGKSAISAALACSFWDHPRVCGEKGDLIPIYCDEVGSPPRMRGKVRLSDSSCWPSGITPAYAGKRHVVNLVKNCEKDHPRVCGEKTKKIP